MKVGRDGSFPRITSSAKGIVPCMKIVEVPEEKRAESGLLYDLVWIGAVENELSDKSSEEAWSDEEDTSTVQLPVENTEKFNDFDSNVKDKSAFNESLNSSVDKQLVRGSRNQRYNNRICNQNNYHSAERNLSPSSTLQNYNSMANTSNLEESNYSHDSINRNSFEASRRNYNQSIPDISGISPWVTPPALEYIAPNFQHAHNNQYGIPNQYVPVGNGLLGNSPYDHMISIPNFQQNSSNVHFNPNFQQNHPNNHFIHDANYTNNGEYHHSDNYQRSDRGRSHHSDNYQRSDCDQSHFQNRRSWNKNRKPYNYWNKDWSNRGRGRSWQSRNRDRYQDRNCPLPSRRQDTSSSQMRSQDTNSSSQMRSQDTNSSQMRSQDTNSSSQMRSQNTNSSSQMRRMNTNSSSQMGSQDTNSSSQMRRMNTNSSLNKRRQDLKNEF